VILSAPAASPLEEPAGVADTPPRLFPADPAAEDPGVRVLTIAEVAERLRIDTRTVHRAIRRGGPVANRLGARAAYRILAREAEAWIGRSVVEPAPPLTAQERAVAAALGPPRPRTRARPGPPAACRSARAPDGRRGPIRASSLAAPGARTAR
jgi:hypothetical protein